MNHYFYQFFDTKMLNYLGHFYCFDQFLYTLKNMSINIVLIGAGEVGFNLAKVLSKENYDLTVVDIDKKKCNRVQNTIDARVIEGNGCSQRILQKIEL